MNTPKRVLVIVCLCSFFVGCSEDPVPGPSEVHPGVGLTIEGQALSLGTTRATMDETLGAPSRVRDMGALGVRFEYPAYDVAGVLSGPGSDATVTQLTVFPDFQTLEPVSLGFGSSQSDIESQYGSPSADPFLGTWRYEDRGVAFEWDGDSLSRIHLFPRRQALQ